MLLAAIRETSLELFWMIPMSVVPVPGFLVYGRDRKRKIGAIFMIRRLLALN